MPSYQPERLERYKPGHLAIAEDIFARVLQEIPTQVERHDGSFSVYGQTVKDTAAKIVIYDPQLGRESNWPRMSDGVYIWVRANGPTGELIWGDTLPVEMPWMLGECGEIEPYRFPLTHKPISHICPSWLAMISARLRLS